MATEIRCSLTVIQLLTLQVNGPTTIELYKYLKTVKPTTAGGFVRCNFSIFIVNRQGVVMERLTANVHPYALDEIVVKYL